MCVYVACLGEGDGGVTRCHADASILACMWGRCSVHARARRGLGVFKRAHTRRGV